MADEEALEDDSHMSHKEALEGDSHMSDEEALEDDSHMSDEEALEDDAVLGIKRTTRHCSKRRRNVMFFNKKVLVFATRTFISYGKRQCFVESPCHGVIIFLQT